MGTFRISTSLNAQPDVVWRHATTPEGINSELWPWLRMTIPRAIGDLTLDDLPVDRRLGRSWILLFGLVPVDYDDITVAELDDRHRFMERSRTLTMRVWHHERTISSRASGCIVEDLLAFAPRRFLALIPGSERLSAAIVARIFRHRHRRLRRIFGG